MDNAIGAYLLGWTQTSVTYNMPLIHNLQENKRTNERTAALNKGIIKLSHFDVHCVIDNETKTQARRAELILRQ